jgi:hypothetical protein
MNIFPPGNYVNQQFDSRRKTVKMAEKLHAQQLS